MLNLRGKISVTSNPSTANNTTTVDTSTSRPFSEVEFVTRSRVVGMLGASNSDDKEEELWVNDNISIGAATNGSDGADDVDGAELGDIVGMVRAGRDI